MSLANSTGPMVMAFFASRLVAALAAAALGFMPAVAAEQETVTGARLALLIANGDYGAADARSSVPGKNAQSLAGELAHAGFSVDLHENLGRDAMRRAVLDFARKIKRGDCVLFFFSGFGIQVEKSTYLVPADADIWTERDVAARSVALADVTRAIEDAGAKAQVLVLDASRRNPFERRFRTLSSGLGPIAVPRDSLLISAAGIGELAEDGEADGSIFVSELLKEMRAPGLGIQEIFSRTAIGVARATNGAERPFVHSSIAQDFYLGPRNTPPVPDKLVPGPSPNIGPLSGEPRPGLVFRDCDLCPDVAVIAPGEFTMGSDDFDTEKPAHRAVIARPFAMGVSEVTFAQWDACVADGGCSYRPSDEGRGRTNLPVGEVSWHDAVAYADWLTRFSGHKYRLPTETEWEYAARGGTTTAFWWGDDARAGFANCRGCGGDGGRRTLPIGSYQANPFGLFDTAGNVAEWVEGCWTDSYRSAVGATGPRAGDPCKQRVVRGGSFDAGPRFVRSSSRFPYDPDLRYYSNGFRVLRELP